MYIFSGGQLAQCSQAILLQYRTYHNMTLGGQCRLKCQLILCITTKGGVS